jgi:hypothetical protein
MRDNLPPFRERKWDHMRRLRVLIVILLLVAMITTACSSNWRLPKIRLPRKGPVDAFLGIIDQVSQLGRNVARQFQGMGGRR